MESIRDEPHVFAVAGDGVHLFSGVVFDAAGMGDDAYVSFFIEKSDGGDDGGTHDCPSACWRAIDQSFAVQSDARWPVAVGEGLVCRGDIPSIEGDQRI